jgi:hypothetical protein
MKDLILANAKAIVAFIATLLTAVFGFDVPVDVQLAVTSLLVALVIWLVPNK